MRLPRQFRGAGPDLLVAKVKRRKMHFPVVWVVPVAAALVDGILICQRAQEFGAKITIQLKDGSGLKIGHAPVKFRGVNIGEVKAIELSQDHQHAVAVVRLHDDPKKEWLEWAPAIPIPAAK